MLIIPPFLLMSKSFKTEISQKSSSKLLFRNQEILPHGAHVAVTEGLGSPAVPRGPCHLHTAPALPIAPGHGSPVSTVKYCHVWAFSPGKIVLFWPPALSRLRSRLVEGVQSFPSSLHPPSVPHAAVCNACFMSFTHSLSKQL